MLKKNCLVWRKPSEKRAGFESGSGKRFYLAWTLLQRRIWQG